MVFAAGHGITDAESNYYFGTYDIDPVHPALEGLPYEEFEGLLDGIPALQKCCSSIRVFPARLTRTSVYLSQARIPEVSARSRCAPLNRFGA